MAVVYSPVTAAWNMKWPEVGKDEGAGYDASTCFVALEVSGKYSPKHIGR
jgi:hypothetical protein